VKIGVSTELAALALAFAAVPALAASAGASAMTPDPVPIRYEVSPRLSGQDLTGLKVTVTFRADADGETRLELPDKWMGRDKQYRNLSDLTVEGATSVVEDGPAARVIRSRPSRMLVLRYTVDATFDHEPRQSDSYPAEPWLRPSWFYADGASIMIDVEGREAAPVRFRWGKAWPKAFVLASNMEDSQAADPRDSVLIGGRDLRIVRAGPMRLALRGTFPFADADLARTLQVILRAERGFFGDAQDAPFLVTAQSLIVENGSTFSGTGKHQAFAMAVTPNLTLDDVRVLLAHEIFHSWNPRRLGKPIGANGYWFSEGFTDFYARRLMMRERLITPQAFVAAWNETLLAYGTSPLIAMPGREAAAQFWAGSGADQLAYQRGALLAATWDQTLRASGSSLDTVLRAQTVLHAKSPETPLPQAFLQAARTQGLDVAPEIALHIDQGQPIRLAPDAFAPCAKVIDVTAPVFDLGFEPQVDDKGVRTVTKLRPDSAAGRAGLRDGAVIVAKRGGVNGDATQPYDLVVRDAGVPAGGPEHTVSFLPQGAARQHFQRLVLAPAAMGDPALCDFRSPPPGP
jgi:predicted metalloprotease with PDZ domain